MSDALKNILDLFLISKVEEQIKRHTKQGIFDDFWSDNIFQILPLHGK